MYDIFNDCAADLVVYASGEVPLLSSEISIGPFVSYHLVKARYATVQ